MRVSLRDRRQLLRIVIASATLACTRTPGADAQAGIGDSSAVPGGLTADVTLAPDAAFIVPATNAATVIQQCSRPTPAAPDSFWTPTPADIAPVEQALLAQVRPAFWARWRETYRSVKAPELPPPRYVRQYVGLAFGPRRIIYVNGFMPHVAISADPAERAWYGEEGDSGPDSARVALRERLGREGYVVCDGGEWYFGIEYDPSQRRFRNLEFNSRG